MLRVLVYAGSGAAIGQKVFAFSLRCRPFVVSAPHTPLWVPPTRRCSALIVSGPTSPSGSTPRWRCSAFLVSGPKSPARPAARGSRYGRPEPADFMITKENRAHRKIFFRDHAERRGGDGLDGLKLAENAGESNALRVP